MRDPPIRRYTTSCSTSAEPPVVGVIRGRLGDREPRLFGTVFLGASILLAALVFVGSALLAAPAVLLVAGDRTPDPDAVSLMRSGAAVVLSVFAPRIATPTVYVMPAWIALVSIVLLVRRPPHAFELEAAPGSRTL